MRKKPKTNQQYLVELVYSGWLELQINKFYMTDTWIYNYED